jgi:hypothetical protein
VDTSVKRFIAPSLTIAVLVPGGCVDREIITHELASADTDGFAQRSGNFPEPARSACGSLPAGVTPIPELVSAWAQDPTDPGETPTAGSGRRLRLSNTGLGCTDDLYVEPSGDAQGCGDTWGWLAEVTLQPFVDAPGVYELDELVGVFDTIRVMNGSCGGEVGGSIEPDPSSSLGPGAQLEIFSISPDCIVGEFRDVTFGLTQPMLELSGGFVAQRCDATAE